MVCFFFASGRVQEFFDTSMLTGEFFSKSTTPLLKWSPHIMAYLLTTINNISNIYYKKKSPEKCN